MSEASRKIRQRPLLVEIFVEMAIVAVIEFVLIAFVLSFILAGQRRDADYLRSEQLARTFAAMVGEGALDPARLETLGRALRLQLETAAETAQIQLAVYVPGQGAQALIGFQEGLDDAATNLLRNAHLSTKPLSPHAATAADAMGLTPWIWSAVALAERAGRPPRGSVLVGVAHESLWNWLWGQWFLIFYITALFLTLLGLGAYRVETLVVKPLEGFVQASRLVVAGARHFNVPIPRTKELFELKNHFEQTTVQLLERENSLRERLEQLEKAQHDLLQAEKMATVGRLASGIAHEVGNPLSAVSGYLDLLKDENLGAAERFDLLNRASQEAERANRTLRTLLDYARPKQLAAGSVEIAPLVHQVIEMVRGRKIFHNVEIVEELDETVRAWADRGQVEQVLVNLLLNAVDAMEGRGRIEVVVEQANVTEAVARSAVFPEPSRGASGGRPLQATERAVCVRVCDSGPGVRAPDVPHLFEPFYSTKAPGTGTGLGLAVSSQIAARHGGVLRLADTGGGDRGACFELWLPHGEERG